MRYVRGFIFMVLVPCFVMAEGVDTNEVQSILKRDDFVALNKMAEGNSEGVIIALKQIQSIASKRSYTKLQITEYLVRLGDEETIKQLVLNMASDDPFVVRRSAAALGISGQLSVIPHLVEYLYLDEPAGLAREFPNTNEFIVPPLSVDAAGLMFGILKRSPLVSEETRQWAENLRTPGIGHTAETRRQQMRDWWPENKQYFEAKEYDKIHPLGAGSPSKESAIETKIVPPSKTEPALTKHTSETNPVSVIAEKETENISSAEKPSRPWRVILLALGILGVAGVGIFGFRKARNRS